MLCRLPLCMRAIDGQAIDDAPVDPAVAQIAQDRATTRQVCAIAGGFIRKGTR